MSFRSRASIGRGGGSRRCRRQPSPNSRGAPLAKTGFGSPRADAAVSAAHASQAVAYFGTPPCPLMAAPPLRLPARPKEKARVNLAAALAAAVRECMCQLSRRAERGQWGVDHA